VQPSCQNDRWLAAGKVATAARLVLTLPDGGVDLPVPDDSAPVFAPDGVCPFGTTGFEHKAMPVRGERSDLKAAVSAPRALRLGDVVNFSVTVTNPTDGQLRLDPCPSYQSWLWGGRGAAHGENYFLNCELLTAVAPTARCATP
jgi:hypothetical protein